MRSRFLPALLLGLAATLQSRCGTLFNVTAAPRESRDLVYLGPHGCEPYGGVQRSSAVGGLLVYTGVGAPLGLAVWAVDLPLSLVGDTLTYPLAVARKNKEPWATWWGEQLSPEEVEKAEKKRREAPPPG